MLIREITDVIERFAPLAWQESYDNAGLIVGRPDDEVRKALLAVDVTDVDDTPGTERCGTVQLGKGAAVKVMDSSVICHPQVVQTLERLAKEQDIPVQRDIMRAGGTDAGAVQAARLGVLTGGVSVPCRYIHTPVEMASLEDAQRCVQLLSAFVTSALD